jgi:putative sigma-54 modulation protein
LTIQFELVDCSIATKLGCMMILSNPITTLYSQRESLAMRIQIVDRNLGITQDQRQHIDRCLQFAFDRFSAQVTTIEISLTDVNGPKGGEDVQCRMKVSLQGKRELVVEGKGVSAEAVVAETADRAALAVSRRIDRLRDVKGTSMSGQ